jgi:hypothetical protein
LYTTSLPTNQKTNCVLISHIKMVFVQLENQVDTCLLQN